MMTMMMVMMTTMMMTMMMMIGGPPDKSKDQNEADEDYAHGQQSIHDNCPRIPGLKKAKQ